jgi:hypothetical protein
MDAAAALRFCHLSSFSPNWLIATFKCIHLHWHDPTENGAKRLEDEQEKTALDKEQNENLK